MTDALLAAISCRALPLVLFYCPLCSSVSAVCVSVDREEERWRGARGYRLKWRPVEEAEAVVVMMLT